MRLPLHVTPSFTSQLPLASSSSSSDPPLVFIDSEPFIVELQGKLDLPEAELEEGGGPDEASRLRGSRVGKIDLTDPKKPTMRIAHHRLEGKLETLLTPYALLRTSRRRRTTTATPEGTLNGEGDDADPGRSNKRPRIADRNQETDGKEGNNLGQKKVLRGGEDEDDEGGTTSTEIEIIGIIRKKIVFNKRPEPLIEISSEADPTAKGDGRKEKDAKRGPKGLLGFGGGKR